MTTESTSTSTVGPSTDKPANYSNAALPVGAIIGIVFGSLSGAAAFVAATLRILKKVRAVARRVDEVSTVVIDRLENINTLFPGAVYGDEEEILEMRDLRLSRDIYARVSTASSSDYESHI